MRHWIIRAEWINLLGLGSIVMRLYKYMFLAGLLCLGFIASSFVLEKSEAESHYTPRDVYKYYVKGKIKDKGSGVELGGATVSVEHKAVELSNCPSGDDGSYEMKFESTIQFTGNELIFIITRDGYFEKRVSNVPVRSDEPIIVNFGIKRKPIPFKRDPHANRWETIEYIKELERY